MDPNIPEEEPSQYYNLDNPDSKEYGLTKSEDEKRKTDLIKYLKDLLDTNAINDQPKENVKSWFFHNVTSKLQDYDKNNKDIKLFYEQLAVQAKARSSQAGGGSKRRKSARIFRKSIRKCKKCKRNYRKSKKSKQV